jgi:anti-sigma B factor antagonist
MADRSVPDTYVVHVEGDFDSVSVPRVREALDSALSRGCREIVLDLTEVTYVDSSALGFVVWADQRLQPVGGRLVLAGATADVARMLAVSGLIGLAPSVAMSASIDDALSGSGSSPSDSDPMWTEAFEFAADAKHMADARARVAEIVAPLGLGDSAVFDMKVAVGEALANAVRHGSPSGSSDMVCVEVRVYPERVDVVVTDRGCGYDGVVKLSQDALAPSGSDVLFMRALMDVVEFRRGEGGGTSVLLAKRRLAQA